MRVYKTKGFARFARRQLIDDAALCDAISRAEQGLIDADLGGGVVKQRVPRPGQGDPAGIEPLFSTASGHEPCSSMASPKVAKTTIDDDDLERFRKLATEFQSYDAKQVGKLVKAGAWIEVECDGYQA